MPTILQLKQSVESEQTGLKGKLKSEQSVSTERIHESGGVSFLALDLRELNHLKGTK